MEPRSTGYGEGASTADIVKDQPTEETRGSLEKAIENLEILMGDLTELHYMAKKSIKARSFREIRQQLQQACLKISGSIDVVAATIKEVASVQKPADEDNVQSTVRGGVAMAERRRWEEQETTQLIRAVRESWTIATKLLVEGGIQCTPLEAKAKWDRVYSFYIKVADHMLKHGAQDFFTMTVNE
ncbi:hypothetical protein R1sor_012828 [Riccia sorocarpa]|uniref:Uncharacterized protein n=1 Tax=Riccia sorocarpa TaxID=122646 RepID=A0ABD3I7M2_9MARC